MIAYPVGGILRIASRCTGEADLVYYDRMCPVRNVCVLTTGEGYSVWLE